MAAAVNIAALQMAAPPTAAQMLTFSYGGDVSSIDPPMDAVFQPGDLIRLRFTFDPTTPDGDPSPADGDYVDAVVTGVMEAPGLDDMVLNGTVTVVDGMFDRFTVSGDLAGVPLGGCTSTGYQLRLSDASGTAITDDDLPTSPPVPADFNTQSIEAHFDCGTDVAEVLTFPVRRLLLFDTFETGDLTGWSTAVP